MNQNQEITDFYKLAIDVLKSLAEMWQAGEGNLSIAIRDEPLPKRAKVEGGAIRRIGGKKVMD